MRRPQIFDKYELSTSRPRLGVMVMSLTPELRKHLGAAEDRGRSRPRFPR